MHPQQRCPGTRSRRIIAAFAGIASLGSGVEGRAGDPEPSAFDFAAREVYRAAAPVILLASGEIDPAQPGAEVVVVLQNGTIVQLAPRASGPWAATTLPITSEPAIHFGTRQTLQIGDVHAGFAGNEIVLETAETLGVLVRTGPGAWQRQIVHDGTILFGIVWGARIGDVDASRPGAEVIYVIEGAGDVSSALYAAEAEGNWAPFEIHGAEVAMDTAIGEFESANPGHEIVLTTEMGPTYAVFPRPGEPGPWPRLTLWDDFDNAGWVVRVADILPQRAGGEIVYGTRYNNRILLSYPDGSGGHAIEVLHQGAANGPASMWDIAVGDVLPETATLEIVGGDDTGSVYLVAHHAGGWSGKTIWQDEAAVYATLIGDFGAGSPGGEILVGGASGAVTLLTRAAARRGDANCDGAVSFFDIDPFVLALFDLPAYQAAFCSGALATVDIDCGGTVDFFDVEPFLECLFGTCPPCP